MIRIWFRDMRTELEGVWLRLLWRVGRLRRRRGGFGVRQE